ncbi:SPOSA6832_03195 [Sporobolomyces salmonicolor]|uniref:SPOSA6832_03195-mRNA-1:cds n=1 Tax=Sporidiobolus salmonicolor TaxID=5005 RepID=A0A0D6EPC0_SPOSA|nr:SPOSA6832_03195 [Sporobolomyces salmonicolor]
MSHRARPSPPSSFHPSAETIAWLFSLPLPPGVISQPQPATPEDWALVEQYRLLCQSLTVLGEYERARRAEGLEAVRWEDLSIPGRDVTSIPHGAGPSALPHPSSSTSTSEPLALAPHNAVTALSHSLSSAYPLTSLPSSSSFAFTSTSPTSFSFDLSLDLPLDLDAAGTGPASLPSLMSAISELEHCVARLSLEANEARNLQRSLRTEMASRQRERGRPASGAGARGRAGAKAGKRKAIEPAKEVKQMAVCEDCGEEMSASEEGESGSDEQHYHNEHAAVEGPAGLGVKAWEDRELMKALESVSMLDKRADEYRERLRVLKDQIHQHAALADALASQSSPATSSTSKMKGKNSGSSANGRGRSFGDVASAF